MLLRILGIFLTSVLNSGGGSTTLVEKMSSTTTTTRRTSCTTTTTRWTNWAAIPTTASSTTIYGFIIVIKMDEKDNNQFWQQSDENNIYNEHTLCTINEPGDLHAVDRNSTGQLHLSGCIHLKHQKLFLFWARFVDIIVRIISAKTTTNTTRSSWFMTNSL